MSNGNNKGQKKVKSFQDERPRIEDGRQALWVGVATAVVIAVVFTLRSLRVIESNTFTWAIIVIAVVVWLLMTAGFFIGQFDRGRADKRRQKAIDKLTPSTSASRKITEMSYEDLERQQRRAGNGNHH